MGSVPFLVHVLTCCIILVDKDVDLELDMFACLIIYGVFILYKLDRLLTLVWYRCVSQVLVAPRINMYREFGVSYGNHIVELGLVDLCRALGC